MAIVVDLTDLAAVYATRLLVEAGHTVIRVEPRQGDALRREGPALARVPALSLESGAYHAFFNAGKQSLTLDVSGADGRAVLLRLLEQADALVASAPLPLPEGEIRSANPSLVMTVVENDEPELCAYARSGLLSITGHPGEEPTMLGAHMAYAATGLYAGLAASAGLFAARQTGVGQTVRVSVAQCLESWMEQPMVTYMTAGVVAERRGFRGAITAVSGAFRCRDGYWMVSVPHGADGWARFVDWVQDPVLSDDPKLADERERLKQRDVVLDRISAWSKDRALDEIVVEAQRRHIPASPVATPVDLVDDPQLVARGFQKLVDHPLLGTVRFPQGAIGTVAGTQVGAAPTLGQHTGEILTALGYSGEEQRALFEAGVV